MDNNTVKAPVEPETNEIQTPAPQCYAVGSMVLGILAISLALLNWSGTSSLIGGFVFGVTGLVFANNAGKAGFRSGARTAGLVLSIISIVLASLSIVACIGIVGVFTCISCAAASMM